MAKEAVLQIRIDADLKREAEELYSRLGTSFTEAVRMFARQSVIDQALPFRLCAMNKSLAAFQRVEREFDGAAQEAGFQTEAELQDYMTEIRKEVRGY